MLRQQKMRPRCIFIVLVAACAALAGGSVLPRGDVDVSAVASMRVRVDEGDAGMRVLADTADRASKQPGVYVSDDVARTRVGATVHIPVLHNDDVVPFHSGAAPVADAGVCITGPLPRPPPLDVTAGQRKAGIFFHDRAKKLLRPLGAPQKIIKTSPNCAFDQFDLSRHTWDKGTLCLPELMTGGSAVADVDGDGLPDLYSTRWDAMDALYRSDGNGSFTDITEEAGLGMTASIHSNAVALVDIDNDGDKDIFISTVGDTRFYLFINDGTGHFTEHAIERGVGLQRPSVPAGAGGLTSAFSLAFGDFDGDGWLDLYTTEWFPRLDMDPAFLRQEVADGASTCRLFRNLGASGKPGYFEDVTTAAGLHVKIGGPKGIEERNTIDEWWETAHQEKVLQILLHAGLPPEEARRRRASLNREMRRLTEEELERSKMVSIFRETLRDTSDNLHGSGKLSVHHLEFPHRGVFQFSARFVDLDKDGHLDLVIAGDFGTTQLYWNNGNGTFRAGHLHLLMDGVDNSMGASFGDINGDGWEDVLFTSMLIRMPARLQADRFFPNAGIAANFEGNHMYINDGGNRLFVDVTDHAGVKDTGWTWGGILVDLDNDGWLDSVMCNGLDDPETTDDEFFTGNPNFAFRNRGPRGNFTFQSIGADVGLDDRRDGRGYLNADLDGDGDQDLFLSNYADYPALLINDGGNQYAFLRVTAVEPGCEQQPDSVQPLVARNGMLHGSGCNPRESVGARVYLYAQPSSKPFYREIGSAAAFLAQSELVAHFGLGPSLSHVHKVVIEWPTHNSTRILYDIPARSSLTVRAPQQRGAVLETHLTKDVSACSSLQLRVSGVSTPSNGSVHVAANGRYVTYIPNPGFLGSDSFTYTATDATGVFQAKTGTVLVNVDAGPAPVVHSSAPLASASTSTTAQQNAAPAPSSTWTIPDCTGRGNNLIDPTRGAANAPMIRLAAPGYAEPEGADLSAGANRPSARSVSNKLMAQRAALPNAAGVNDLFLFFANFVAHDLTFTSYMHDLRRPSEGTLAKDNIAVPPGDIQWDPAGTGAVRMPFRRSPHLLMVPTSGPMQGTRSRQQVNMVTSFADLDIVYGSDAKRGAAVRGRDWVQADRHYRQRGWLLLQLHENVVSHASAAAVVPAGFSRERFATDADLGTHVGYIKRSLPPMNLLELPVINPFGKLPKTMLLTGDERANYHPGMILMHTLFHRLHNRIAAELVASPAEAGHIRALVSRLDPEATSEDDRLFTAAQVMTRARYQALLWSEFLPTVIGPGMHAGLPAYSGYNASIDASTSNEFAVAAFTFWHSQFGSVIKRLDEQGSVIQRGHIPLRDAWFAPHRVLHEGGLDPILRGALATHAQEVDLLFSEDVRNFYVAGTMQGLDLAAMDVQRGRDHGMPTINAARAVLGLPPYGSLDALVNASGLPARAAAHVSARLHELYSSIDDVDLLVAGLVEQHVPGGVVGPTFAHIIADQFLRLRDGDRYWYENEQAPTYGILRGAHDLDWYRNTSMAWLLQQVTNVEVPTSRRGDRRSAFLATEAL